MARFIYDVDKTTRYIDVHKQFQGGLKTVDTDDALKDIYLREAENISLSEFNFIEKRYGLHKLTEHAPWLSLTSVSSIVQGYFEYYVDANTVDRIIVIEGKFYVNRDDNGFELVEEFNFEDPTNTFDLDLVNMGAGVIQSTRPVEGVRIDDKLYIATGTYPVYYKGDGNIYVFPQYEHSDLDIQNLGYNLNSVDLEADFSTPAFTATSSHGTTLNGNTVVIDSIAIKDSQISKRFPFVGETTPTEIKIAIHLYNNASLNRWGGTGTDVTLDSNLFDSQMTTTELNSWLGTPTAGVDLNTIYGKITEDQTPEVFGAPVFTNRRYRIVLKPIIYIKPAGSLPSLYEEITSVGNIELNNDVHSNLLNRLPNSSITLNNFVFKLKELAAGYWDFKIEFKLTQTGYFYPSELSTETNLTTEYNKIRTKILDVKVVEFTNIWVTEEELTDYKEEPYDSLKIHTCNRVIEHNGRLGFFGSTINPDYIFFSTISAKEYFPYRYSLQFTNDLKEGITAINRFMNILVVQSDSFTFGIKGDSPFPLTAAEGEIYRKIMINPTIGCIAPYSVKNVRNQLYFLSKEGIFTLRALYAEDNRYNVDPIDRNIYNIVPRDTNAVCAYFDDQYWLHFPTTGETLRYYVDKKAWVKDTYAAWNNFGGVFKYINESGKLRFITQLSQLEATEPVKIFDIEVDYALPTDLTKKITSKFTTSYLNQNQPFHPKNYKEAKFDFSIQNEYNIGKEPIVGTNFNEVQFGSTKYFFFTANLTSRHFYQITLAKNEVNAGTYTVRVNGEIRKTGTFLDTDPVSLSWQPIEFQIFDTDTMPCTIEVRSAGLNLGVTNESVAVLYDSTYDHSVTFNTLVLSEEGTLNVDPIDSYTSADVAIPIDLGTRTGNWTFGTSDFGNVIVAVKTVKLAGRGYNSKVSVIENSKSKWTLESLGITYKMKKARSR